MDMRLNLLGRLLRPPGEVRQVMGMLPGIEL
jgi:hypothetical protein